MTQIQGIPTPTDSYDQSHTSLSTLTSLRALSASFDATIESLTQTVQSHMRQLDDLSVRAQRCQEKVDRLRRIRRIRGKEETKEEKESDVYRSTLKLSFPECYEDVTNMGDARTELGSRRSSGVGGDDGGGGGSNSDRALCSALSNARLKSNAAVIEVLRQDASRTFENDGDSDRDEDCDDNDGTTPSLIADARPSDVWLDRASGFEEGKSARLAVRLDSMPPLVSNNSVRINNDGSSNNSTSGGDNRSSLSIRNEEAEYYRHGIQRIEEETSSSVASADGGFGNVGGIGLRPQGSVGTEPSRDTIGTNYSLLSHATASNRRRQRMLAAKASSTSSSARRSEGVEGGSRADGVDSFGTGSHNHNRNSNNNNNNSGGSSSNAPLARQQVMTGSLPYLCEVLHDTYGLGPPPNDLDDGNVFQELRDVCDLAIYGTNRLAYGSRVCPLSEHEEISCSSGTTATTATTTSATNAGTTRRRYGNEKVGKATMNERNVSKPEALGGGGGGDGNDSGAGIPVDTARITTKMNPTAYVPDALTKDAGLFQLPENLPL